MIKVNNIRLELNEEITTEKIAEFIGAKPGDILSYNIVKKAVDARRKTDVHYVCSFEIEVKNEKKYIGRKNIEIKNTKEYVFPEQEPLKMNPVIIGSGPAGLFAALMLAEKGHRPILLERGEAVDERVKTVERFQKNGVLNPNSNIQFGEGGAGTFSDGKLTTGIKNPRCRTVLEAFVKFGAPKEILYQAKPHIGTDILRNVVKNMRKHIIECGGEVRFKSCVEDFLTDNSRIIGLIVNGEEIKAEKVILAIGHSARDTIKSLYESGAEMTQKAFSLGARIEHQQKLINKSQYGESAKYLGAADYKLSAHLENGRGVYTFCMCPGGMVIAAASEEGGVVTNGMSNYKRDGENANSALLVSVTPKDFPSEHPLAGIELQRAIEKKAFEAGGKSYSAPAQLVGDFLKNIPSKEGEDVIPTYKPDVKWGNIDEILPDYVTNSMRQAIILFDKKLSGFAEDGAVLTAPETRSSSPVRIVRDSQTCQSNIKGLFPCGEGAGYAGGIMSAAVDGIICAEKLILSEN